MRSFVLVIVLCLSSIASAQESSPATRSALAHQLYDASIAGLTMGSSRPSDVYEWSERWMRADLEAHVANAAQMHFDRMNTLLAMVHGQVVAGTARTSEELACQYYVAEARAWMARPPITP
jgi:hypothetical protein